MARCPILSGKFGSSAQERSSVRTGEGAGAAVVAGVRLPDGVGNVGLLILGVGPEADHRQEGDAGENDLERHLEDF